MRIKFALILFVFTAHLVIGQSRNGFESISIKEGLSHNEIWDFEQDKYGYMWVATADGLNKYDGYTFRIYKNDPSDSTSLPGNLITNVLEDKNGVLWVGSSEGLSRFDRAAEKFENYRFINSTRENSNFVHYLFEDSRGILWVATNTGYKSYNRDTKKFEDYEILRIDNSVASQAVGSRAMFESPDNKLYGSSLGYGLVRFDYENRLFVQLNLKDNGQSKLEEQNVYSLTMDSKGRIWLSGRKGLFRIDLNTMSVSSVKNSISGSTFNLPLATYEDRQGKMWIGTFRDGLFLYDLESEETVRTDYNNFAYYGFYEDKTGILWMGSFQGILKYNFDKAPYELYTFQADVNQSRPIVISMYESKYYENYIWLGTRDGLLIFDKVNRKVVFDSPVISRINSLGPLIIEDIVESKDNKLYIGTTRNSLYVYDLKTSKIKQYKPRRYSRSSINFSDVNVILEDSKNRIWVGQEQGLSLFEGEKESFSRIPNKTFRQYDEELENFLSGLRKDSVPLSEMIGVGDYQDLTKEFVLGEDSKIIISSIGEGLPAWGMVDYGFLQSSEGDTLWSMKNLDDTFYAGGGFKNRNQIGILELKKGRYKLRYISDDSHSAVSYNDVPPKDSLHWGIQLFSLSENDFIKFSGLLDQDLEKTFMNGNNVMSIAEGSDNKILVATIGGMSIVDPETFEIRNLLAENSDGLKISSNNVEDIIEDDSGNIWIATQNGLNKYSRAEEKIRIYREKDGLPSNNLRALQLDDDGNLWTSSIKGLSKVELNEETNNLLFINYDVTDGLQGYTFIGNASMKDKEGKLYFSGPDGLNAFKPSSTDKSLPKVVFTSLSVSNKSHNEMFEDLLQTKNLNDMQELKLAYNQNDFSIEFASIHFARPAKNRIQYKLEGVDEIWHDGSRRIASYTNLDPGEYIFKVKGSNGDGYWIDKPKELFVVITPAWWNNIYAYFAYGAIFFGFLYGVRKFEIERKSKINEYKQSKLRAEAAELKAKAAEAERRILEVEFNQKKKELEEARELQLSMLPEKLPELPNLDIAVYMKTATEVGGDYYDFNVAMDGTLTVVLGDATGHGMKAGTMVTTAKSLFHSYAANSDILFTFHEMTRCIKQMRMQMLSMCLTMLKIQGSRLLMSSAGMPPVFIFRRESRSIEEHLMKGMPLGTMNKYPYEVKEMELKRGDTLLVLSDGLPELQNRSGNLYGYKRVRNKFEEVAEKNPEEIIEFLKNDGSEWVNHEDPDDDVTFVVIKVK